MEALIVVLTVAIGMGISLTLGVLLHKAMVELIFRLMHWNVARRRQIEIERLRNAAAL